MAKQVVMPRISMTMIEGVVVKWHKNVGDTVKEGEPLLEVETDKIAQTMNVPYSGVLLQIVAQEGDVVAVDAPICTIGVAGESADPVPTPQPQPSTAASAASVSSNDIHTVVMPRISMTMIEGVVMKWLKQVGQTVAEGEPLLEVETDKIAQTMNAPYSGVLLRIDAAEGDVVPVDSPICVIGKAGAALLAAQSSDAGPALAPPAASISTAPAPAAYGRVAATPLAKKIATEKGYSLTAITGTGVRGMITKADVLAYVAVKPDVHSSAAASDAEDTLVPFVGIRRRIADNMMLTKQTMADVTTFAEVHLGRIKELRRNMKVSYTTFAVRAAAMALTEFPYINAQIEADNIVLKKRVNVNVAVATDRGLITPVIRNADRKNLLSIAEEMDDLAARGRSNRLTSEDLTGGTFTITNSGVYGAMFFTPIINAPQCAILGMGKMFTLALVDEAGTIVPTTLMMLSLSYDHRIVDGETAVKFLQRVKYYLENPVEMLRPSARKEN